MDNTTTVGALIEEIGQFIDERDWNRYHDPKNLSMSIAIESAELMEIFQWMFSDQVQKRCDNDGVRAKVEDEVADVMIYTLSLCRALGIDASEAVIRKLARNRERFPPGDKLLQF